MKYSISFNFKYSSMKMNWEKWIFHCEKWDCEPIGNSLHITEYLALGKTLLARLYVKVKVYTTNVLSVYNLQKFFALNEIILFGSLYFWGLLWTWKLTLPFVNIFSFTHFFLCFCFLDDLLKLHLFTTCFYFYLNWWWERGKKSIKSIFDGYYLNLRRKIWKLINTCDSR